jgi:hypothetical protein
MVHYHTPYNLSTYLCGQIAHQYNEICQCVQTYYVKLKTYLIQTENSLHYWYNMSLICSIYPNIRQGFQAHLQLKFAEVCLLPLPDLSAHCNNSRTTLWMWDFAHPWWWRQYAPLKRRSTIILHGSITQKTALNIILYGFSWNFTLSSFTKICQHIPILVKSNNNRHFEWRSMCISVHRRDSVANPQPADQICEESPWWHQHPAGKVSGPTHMVINLTCSTRNTCKCQRSNLVTAPNLLYYSCTSKPIQLMVIRSANNTNNSRALKKYSISENNIRLCKMGRRQLSSTASSTKKTLWKWKVKYNCTYEFYLNQ